MKQIKKLIYSMIMFLMGTNKKALQLFAANPNTNTTGTSGLSSTMKTMYIKELLENARTELYHTQLAKHFPLAKNHGKTAEWRKWRTFAVSTTPLTEGVTPDGDTLGQTSQVVTITQYGRYAVISDILNLTSLDDTMMGATEEIGAVAGETEDILTRNVLVAGTNVMYAPKNGTFTTANKVTSRSELDATCLLTPKVVSRVATIMKKNKVPRIKGKYVCLIHPSLAEDLRNSEDWIKFHEYSATTEIFNGEIGELHGVRFIECTNAKVWKGITDSCPTELSVYGCIFLGKDAYGMLDTEGGSREMIVHQAGSSGVADALNQRSSVGFKFCWASAILYTERVLRLECVSSYGDEDDAN